MRIHWTSRGKAAGAMGLGILALVGLIVAGCFYPVVFVVLYGVFIGGLLLTMVGMLLSIPYGALVDHFERKRRGTRR